MGYTTEFEGQIDIHPPLSAAEATFLRKFAHTRHMKRTTGPYVVEETAYTETNRKDVIDYNTEHEGQPSLWCQWVPNDDGTALVWDGGEKFYESAAWMQYLIDHFLAPNALAVGKVKGITGGHTLTGIIQAEGEEQGDIWHLVVKHNKVSTQDGTPTAHTLMDVEAAKPKP
jgi:hypothetical protein